MFDQFITPFSVFCILVTFVIIDYIVLASIIRNINHQQSVIKKLSGMVYNIPEVKPINYKLIELKNLFLSQIRNNDDKLTICINTYLAESGVPAITKDHISTSKLTYVDLYKPDGTTDLSTDKYLLVIPELKLNIYMYYSQKTNRFTSVYKIITDAIV